MDVMGTVRLLLHQVHGKLFRKEDLPYVRGVACGVAVCLAVAAEPNLQVDVVDAALVEARDNGAEGHGAFAARDLDASAEGELVGRLHCRRSIWRAPFAGFVSVEAAGRHASVPIAIALHAGRRLA